MKLVLLSLYFLTMNAYADEACVAQGQVQIKVNNMIEIVRGRIGDKEILLFQYGNMLVGEVEGLKTEIRLIGSQAVGAIGETPIRWLYTSSIAMVTGNQVCILQ